MTKFWEASPKTGRKPKYDNPDDLWQDALDYFQWAEENPLYEHKGFAFQGEVTVEEIPKMRALTIQGMCVFLGIGKSTFDDYTNRPLFSEVCARIREVMYSQKFEGASAGLLSASIIARDLGLAEKQQVENTITVNSLDDFYQDQTQSDT